MSFFALLVVIPIFLTSCSLHPQRIENTPLPKVTTVPPSAKTTIQMSDKEQWQLYLKNQLLDKKMSETDYLILNEIIFCESGWQQFWNNEGEGHKKGDLVISQGNVGLAQINRYAHRARYTALGLNPDDPFDNIDYAIILYQENGVGDWRQWSGHCWLPRLLKLGIKI